MTSSPIAATPPPSSPPPIPSSPDPSSTASSTTLTPGTSASVHLPPPAAAHTLVLIDAGLPDLPVLLAGLEAGCQAVLVQRDQDALELLAAAASERAAAQRSAGASCATATPWRLAVVAHGAPGCVFIGREPLTANAIQRHATAWQQLSPAAVDLYSCHTGLDASLAEALAGVTGARVRLSKGIVGHAAVGGSWGLESPAGAAAANGVVPFRRAAREAWVVGLVDYFFNNNAADDDGDGLSAGTAKKFFASIKALGDGNLSDDTITIVNGATLTETFAELDAVNSIRKEAGGSGAVVVQIPAASSAADLGAITLDGTNTPSLTASFTETQAFTGNLQSFSAAIETGVTVTLSGAIANNKVFDGPGSLAVNAGDLADNANLALAGSANKTVAGLVADLSLAASNTGTTGVTTGDASLTIDANAAAGALTVNAAALGQDKTLTISGGANGTTAAVNNLVANLFAPTLASVLTVDLADDTVNSAISITTGTHTTTINDSADGDTITVVATALADNQTLSIGGAGNFTITNLIGDLSSTANGGAIQITTAPVANQTLSLGSGTAGTRTVDASANLDGQSITITGAGSLLLSSTDADIDASTYTGPITTTATTTSGNTVNITSGTAADSIVSTAGIDIINTGGSNDTINGGAAADSLNGGNGNDLFVVSSANDLAAGETIQGGSGTDTLNLAAGVYDATELSGTVAVENVVITGDAAGTSLTFAAGAFTDSTTGNTITVSASTPLTNGVVIDASSAGSGSELVTLSDNLNGADTISGGAGNDTLSSGAGNDLLTAGAGNDSIVAGTGNDLIQFLSANLDSNDTVQGGSDTDALSITDAATVVDSDFTSVSGIEELRLANASNSVTLGTIADNNGNLTVTGGSGSDTLSLIDFAANVTFNAAAGNDLLSYADDSNAQTFTITATSSGAATGTATGGVGTDTFTGLASIAGSSKADQLIDSTGGSSVTITAANTGTINDFDFTGVENLSLGGGNDGVTVVGATEGVSLTGTLDLGDGDNTLLMSSGSGSVDSVVSGSGIDSISLNAGSITKGLSTGDSADVVTLNATTSINGAVSLESGNDRLYLNSATINAAVDMGSGADTIGLAATSSVGSLITGNVTLGAAGSNENDSLSVSSSTISGSVYMGGGVDTVYLSSATIGTGSQTLSLGNDSISSDGADSLYASGSSITASVFTGSGSDTINLTASTRISGDVTLGIEGDTNGIGADLLTLNASTISGAVQTGSAADSVDLAANSSIGSAVTLGTDVTSDAADTLNLASSTIAGAVTTGYGNDSLVLSGSRITINVESGYGADSISIGGSSSIGGNLTTGGDTNDDGADSISVSSSTISGSVATGAGADTVNLSSATIGGGSGSDSIVLGTNSNGSDGGDSLLASGSSITASVFTGSGSDTINLTASTRISGDVTLGIEGDTNGIGADLLTLNASTISGAVQTGSAADSVDLAANSSIGGAVTLGTDVISDAADTLNLASSTIAGAVTTGYGNDSLVLSGSRITINVESGYGADSISISSSSSIGGNLTTGDNTANDGADSISVSSSTISGSVASGAGADTVNLSNATIGGSGESITLGADSIAGNDGSDSLLASSSSITAAVYGGAGADTLDLSGSRITGAVTLGATNDTINGGDDRLYLSSTTISGAVEMGAGADSIGLVSNSSIFGAVTLGTDGASNDQADTLSLASSSISGDVGMGAGADSLWLSASTITGAVTTGIGADTVSLAAVSTTGSLITLDLTLGADANSENDSLSVASSTINGSIYTGGGADTVNLSSATIGTGSQTINLGADSQGNDGADSLLASGSSINASVFTGSGSDTINLTVSSRISGDVTLGIEGDTNGIGADLLTLNASTIAGSVQTGSAADSVDLANNSSIGGAVTLGTDVATDAADTLNLANSTIAGAVTTGYGNDSLVLSGSRITSYVDTGLGADIVSLDASSSIGGNVTLGAAGSNDNDSLSVSSSTISGSVYAGGGADTVYLSSATIGGGSDSIELGTNSNPSDGADTLTATSTTINASIVGGSGADSITLTLTTVNGAVTLGIDGDVTNGGDDRLYLSGTTISGAVQMGAGADSIGLVSNSSIGSSVFLGSDGDNSDLADTLSLANSSISGAVTTGYGADTLILSTSTITGNIDTGLGGDTLGLSSSSLISGNVTLGAAGSNENDSLSVSSSTITGSVYTGGGVDTVYLSSATIGGGSESIELGSNNNGSDGADSLLATGSSINASVFTGSGSDTINLTASTRISGDVTLGVANDSVSSGADVLTLNLSTIAGSVQTGSAADSVDLANNSSIGGAVTLGTDADTSDTADTLSLANSSISGAVTTGYGADTLILSASAITGNIDTGLGGDTLGLSSSSLISGNVTLGAAGSNENDSLSVSSSTITGSVYTGGGVDTVYLSSATIGINLNTGDDSSSDGGDTLSISSSSIAGSFTTGAGADTVYLSSATIGGSGQTFSLGTDTNNQDGDDTLYASSSSITATITTGSGDDTLNLSGSTLTGAVTLGIDGDVTNGGDDRLYLSGTTISGAVQMGAGADSIGLVSNSSIGSSVILGSDGDNSDLADTLSLANSWISGDVTTGTGSDSIYLSSATITGTVSTGAGADTVIASTGVDSITTAGGFDVISLGTANELANDNVDGGAGFDSLSFNGGGQVTLTITNYDTQAGTSTGQGSDTFQGIEALAGNTAHTDTLQGLSLATNEVVTLTGLDTGAIALEDTNRTSYALGDGTYTGSTTNSFQPVLETFDSMAGWSAASGITLATTQVAGSAELGTYASGAAGADVWKTFTTNGQDVVLHFDLHRLDSWDNGESFSVYIGDGATTATTEVFQYNFTMESIASDQSGTTAIGSAWQLSPLNSATNFYNAAWVDQTLQVSITIPVSANTLTIGFGSNLNQGSEDESWAIDNLRLVPSDGFLFNSFGSIALDAGNDSFDLIGSASITNVLDGGVGTDLLNYIGYGSAATVDLSTGTATGIGSFAGQANKILGNFGTPEATSDSSIENVYGSAYGDTITGDSTANVIRGNGANDTIVAGAGNDDIDGGDRTSGLDGNDSIIAGSGADTIRGSDGNDTIYGGHTSGDDSSVDLITYNDEEEGVVLTLTGLDRGTVAAVDGVGSSFTLTINPTSGEGSSNAGSYHYTYDPSTGVGSVSAISPTWTDTVQDVEKWVLTEQNDLIQISPSGDYLSAEATSLQIDAGGGFDILDYSTFQAPLGETAGNRVFVNLSDSVFHFDINLSGDRTSNSGLDAADLLIGEYVLEQTQTGSRLNVSSGSGEGGSNAIVSSAEVPLGATVSVSHTTERITLAAAFQGSSFPLTTGTRILFQQHESIPGSGIEAGRDYFVINPDQATASFQIASIPGGAAVDLLISSSSVLSAYRPQDSSIEGVIGGGADDVLVGDDDANLLVGNGGDDLIAGGAGNDTIFGGEGDDFIVPGAGSDFVNGGRGINTVRVTSSDLNNDTFTFDDDGVNNLDLFDAGGGDDGDVNTIDGVFYLAPSEAGVDLVNGGDGIAKSVVGTTGGDFIDFNGVATRNITAVEGGVGDDTIGTATISKLVTTRYDGGADTDTLTLNLTFDQLAAINQSGAFSRDVRKFTENASGGFSTPELNVEATNFERGNIGIVTTRDEYGLQGDPVAITLNRVIGVDGDSAGRTVSSGNDLTLSAVADATSTAEAISVFDLSAAAVQADQVKAVDSITFTIGDNLSGSAAAIHTATAIASTGSYLPVAPLDSRFEEGRTDAVLAAYGLGVDRSTINAGGDVNLSLSGSVDASTTARSMSTVADADGTVEVAGSRDSSFTAGVDLALDLTADARQSVDASNTNGLSLAGLASRAYAIDDANITDAAADSVSGGATLNLSASATTSNTVSARSIGDGALGSVNLVDNGEAKNDRVFTSLIGDSFPLITGDRIRFRQSGGGVEADRDYYVLSPMGVTGEFQIASTPDGEEVNITGPVTLQLYRPGDATADGIALATGINLDRTGAGTPGVLAGSSLSLDAAAVQTLSAESSSVEGNAVAGLNRLGSLEGIDVDPLSRVTGIEATSIQAGSDAVLAARGDLAAEASALSVAGDASTELNGVSSGILGAATGTSLSSGDAATVEASSSLDLAAASSSTEGMARAMAGAGAGAAATGGTFASSVAIDDTTASAGEALDLSATASLNLDATASTTGGSRSLSGASANAAGDFLTIFNHRLNEGDVLQIAAPGASGLTANTDYVTRLAVFGEVNPVTSTIAWGDRDGDGTADFTLPNGTPIRFGLNSSSALESAARRYGLDLGATYYVRESTSTSFKVATTATGLDGTGVSTLVDLDPDNVGIDDPLIDLDRIQLSTSAETSAPVVPISADVASTLSFSRPSAATVLAGSRQDDTSLTATADLLANNEISTVTGIDGNSGGLRSLIAGASAVVSAFADGVLSAFGRNTDGDATAAAGTVATGLRDSAITAGQDGSIEAVAELQATAEAVTTGTPLAAASDPVLDDAVANLNLLATGLQASRSDSDISIGADGDLVAAATISGRSSAAGTTANSDALASLEATGLNADNAGVAITIGGSGTVDVSALVGTAAAPLLVEAVSAARGDAAALAGVDVGGILGTLTGAQYSSLEAGAVQSAVAAEAYANLELSATAVGGAAIARLSDAFGGSSDVIGIRDISLTLGAGLSSLDARAVGQAELSARSIDDDATASAATSSVGILGNSATPLPVSFAENGRIAAIASQSAFAEAISVQGNATSSLSDASRGMEGLTITTADSLTSNTSASSQLRSRAFTVEGSASS